MDGGIRITADDIHFNKMITLVMMTHKQHIPLVPKEQIARIIVGNVRCATRRVEKIYNLRTLHLRFKL